MTVDFSDFGLEDIIVLGGLFIALVLALRNRITRQTIADQDQLIKTQESRIQAEKTEKEEYLRDLETMKKDLGEQAKHIAYLEGIVTGRDTLVQISDDLKKHHQVTRTEHQEITLLLQELRDRFTITRDRFEVGEGSVTRDHTGTSRKGDESIGP
jgi:hypothetical protein